MPDGHTVNNLAADAKWGLCSHAVLRQHARLQEVVGTLLALSSLQRCLLQTQSCWVESGGVLGRRGRESVLGFKSRQGSILSNPAGI